MLEGVVVKIINNHEVVINKGIRDGVKVGKKFSLYNLGEEIFDPETKENLGILEEPCGIAEIKTVQEKMSILVSNEYTIEKIKKKTPNMSLLGSIYALYNTDETEEEKKQIISFRNIKIGMTRCREMDNI